MEFFKIVRTAIVVILLAPACGGGAPSGVPAENHETTGSTDSGPVPEGTREDPYIGRGTIKTVQPERKRVVIQHENIPHFMEAMTMAFPVSDSEIVRSISVGDSVEFKIARLNGHFEIFEMRKLEGSE